MKSRVHHFLIIVSSLFLASCNMPAGGFAPGTQLESLLPPADMFGTIRDAVTGSILVGATISLSRSGVVYASTVTDSAGNYRLSSGNGGNYLATFANAGYITLANVPVTLISTNKNVNKSLSQPMLAGQYRIVMNWYGNSGPEVLSDIDSYFSNSSSATYIFYGHKTEPWADGSSAVLDHDVTNYQGPETITLSNINNSGTYRYYINNFSAQSNCLGLGNSGVHVDVYSGAAAINSYDLAPSATNGGVIYEVFQIVNGHVIDINQFNNALPATITNPSCI